MSRQKLSDFKKKVRIMMKCSNVEASSVVIVNGHKPEKNSRRGPPSSTAGSPTNTTLNTLLGSNHGFFLMAIKS